MAYVIYIICGSGLLNYTEVRGPISIVKKYLLFAKTNIRKHGKPMARQNQFGRILLLLFVFRFSRVHNIVVCYFFFLTDVVILVIMVIRNQNYTSHNIWNNDNNIYVLTIWQWTYVEQDAQILHYIAYKVTIRSCLPNTSKTATLFIIFFHILSGQPIFFNIFNQTVEKFLHENGSRMFCYFIITSVIKKNIYIYIYKTESHSCIS